MTTKIITVSNQKGGDRQDNDRCEPCARSDLEEQAKCY